MARIFMLIGIITMAYGVYTINDPVVYVIAGFFSFIVGAVALDVSKS